MRFSYRDLRRLPVILLAIALPFVHGSAAAPAERPTDSGAKLLNDLTATLEGDGAPPSPSQTRVARGQDFYVRFLGAPPSARFSVDPGARISPEIAAQSFLNRWGGIFAPRSPSMQFVHFRTVERNGRWYTKRRQTWRGLPVFGAQIIVQLDRSRGVESAFSDVMCQTGGLENGEISTTPTLSAGEARLAALTWERDDYKNIDLRASTPELTIYAPEVVGESGPTEVVWQTIVSDPTQTRVKDLLLVDAHTGKVPLRFSMLMDVKSRQVFNANNVPGVDPGALVRSEGQAASGIVDADLAYDYFGSTYDFYLNEHGRDSIDGAGMTMSGTVKFCPGPPCPFPNALWNGLRMYFGEGFSAADDVVGHELTHGVTQYESNLIYLNESGAINESLSDIWGEFIDQTNSQGTDTPGVKWLMGEDIPGFGAGRNMADPPSFNDPDRRFSPLWYSGSDDNGGVHTNSGVGNKLCFLLTDGGTFNGHTVAGMGIPAVADLFYECQSGLLSPSSDYGDLYLALTQAALNLGLPQPIRDNIEEACLAVEIKPVANKIGDFRAVSSQGSPNVSLSWVNPEVDEFQGVAIRRATGGYPETPADGIPVFDAIGVSTTDGPLILDAQYYYTAWAYFGGTNYSAPSHATVFVGVDAIDRFTEAFEIEDNDLDRSRIVLTPAGNSSSYTICREISTLAFPVDPSSGTALTMADDSYFEVALTGGAQVNLYGVSYSSFFVGSNGYITFGSSDRDFGETLADHFAIPRIAALFDDLAPNLGGRVSWEQLDDRAVVTFENVPEYPGGDSNSFQIEMFFDGVIAIAWLGIDVTDGLAGLSQGLGIPVHFIESDLNGGPTCDPNHLTVYPATDFSASGPDGGPFTPAGSTYTLANAGHTPLNWTAAAAVPWLDMSPTTGTLGVGGVAPILVGLNAQSLSLATGAYNGLLTFNNITEGGGRTRNVLLTVGAPSLPGAPDPPDGAVGIGLSPTLTWTAPGFSEMGLDGCPTLFDVFLGTDESGLSAICSDLAAASCDPARLKAETTYYWKVVAKRCSALTAGPVWRFTTVSRGGVSSGQWRQYE